MIQKTGDPMTLETMPNHDCLAHCGMEAISTIKLAKDEQAAHEAHFSCRMDTCSQGFRRSSCTGWYMAMNQSPKTAPRLLYRHVGPPLLDYYERNDSIVISYKWKLHHVFIHVFWLSIMEKWKVISWLTCNDRFKMVQASLQMSESIGNIERWYYFLSFLQILLWTSSNIK